MPDHRRPARAEPVQRGADPAGLSRDVVPAGGARRSPVTEQVDTDDTVGTRQPRDHRVPPGRRGRGAVDQQQGGRARLAVLHDVHDHRQAEQTGRERPGRRTCALPLRSLLSSGQVFATAGLGAMPDMTASIASAPPGVLEKCFAFVASATSIGASRWPGWKVTSWMCAPGRPTRCRRPRATARSQRPWALPRRRS